jgi:hypothetical protein
MLIALPGMFVGTVIVAGQTGICLDFTNFQYPWDKPEGTPVTWHWLGSRAAANVKLANGLHKFLDDPTASDIERSASPRLQIESVNYGVLDGDGTDVAVAINYSTGGTANWDYVYVFKLRHHRAPKLLDRLESGSRAAGGLVRVVIRDGQLILEFADLDRQVGECCSEGFIRVRYKWRDGRFIEEGPRVKGDIK